MCGLDNRVSLLEGTPQVPFFLQLITHINTFAGLFKFELCIDKLE